MYDTRCLMSQMNPMKKNMMNLDLNPSHLVRPVPDWVGCSVVYDLLYVSHFLLMSHVMVFEGDLLSYK